MTRQEAIACGSKRYSGKVCDKHPDLGGLRRVAHGCVGCNRERQRTPEYLACQRAWQRAYRKTPESRAYHRAYNGTPKIRARYRARRRAYQNTRRKTDPQFRAGKVIQTCVANALQYGKKDRRTHELLGCSIKFFVKYLAVLASYEGWTWEDHGKKWHIDHIRPCASFDLTDPEQALACNHYTNLEPIDGKENIRKANVWDGSRWSRGKRVGEIDATPPQHRVVHAQIDRKNLSI